MSHWFACLIEETLSTGQSRKLHRIERGFAFTQGDERSGFEIEAASEPFDRVSAALADDLEQREATERFVEMPDNLAVRVLDRTSITSDGRTRSVASSSTVVLFSNGFSFVTTPDRVPADCELLRGLAGRSTRVLSAKERAVTPVTWSHGSGAVLLHEAIGHPSERGIYLPDWPAWLEVEDQPLSGELVELVSDDVGRTAFTTDLAHERPSALRRWSHRDVPMRRMTNLVARGSGREQAELPDPRIDVRLVSHGSWDPLSDEVRVRIDAADFVHERLRDPITPFIFKIRRVDLSSRLSGWFGRPIRHPGVICSEEGVHLPVGSVSVGLLMETP